MKILAIDTSCDETAAAVTEKTKVISNVVWSQASLHAKWGGIVPSLAQRMHEERIDFVVQKTLVNGKCKIEDLDAIGVTVGPGLSIALGEALDKGARMLGLGYLGGAILEKFAHSASSGQARSNPYTLPIPIIGQEKRKIFTYLPLLSRMSPSNI